MELYELLEKVSKRKIRQGDILTMTSKYDPDYPTDCKQIIWNGENFRILDSDGAMDYDIFEVYDLINLCEFNYELFTAKHKKEELELRGTNSMLSHTQPIENCETLEIVYWYTENNCETIGYWDCGDFTFVGDRFREDKIDKIILYKLILQGYSIIKEREDCE